MRIKSSKKARDERHEYNNEDINRLFSNPVYEKTHKEHESYLKFGKIRYWIPLIALYSGMRLNEICQLYIEDIVIIDKIPCFDINDRLDKQLKNRTSVRIVPIHPVLLEKGFLAYVEKLKKAGETRLWPEILRSRDGYGHSFSNFWQRYNRKFITQDKKKNFHSFRHSFISILKRKGVDTSIISELVGHSHDSITMDRYGKGYEMERLLKSIIRLDFDRTKKLKCKISI
jgi:integrase